MGVNTLSVYDLVCRNAVAFGTHPAWVEPAIDRTLTFAEFRESVERLASGLQAAGVAPGDRIGVVGRNSLQFMLLFGAAAAAGAILVPVNWRLSAEEICYIINDTEPRLIFSDAEFQKILLGMSDRTPSVRSYYALNSGTSDFLDFDSLMAAADPACLPAVGLDDGLLIIHTAAVGGQPRGALLSHGNLLWSTLQLAGYFGLDSRDVNLNLLPMFHVAGLFMTVVAIQAGARTVNMEHFEADRAAALIEEHGVSVLFEFAPILDGILDAAESANRNLSSVRHVAGLDSPATIDRFHIATDGRFHVLYGQTETSAIATIAAYNDGPGSAGRPLPAAQVGIMDDAGLLLPVGQTGEIVVRGPLVFKGYWNRADDTRFAMRYDWHHTGDLGRFDATGCLFFEGRTPDKELIKTGGENVYPAEVEQTLVDHPQVSAAVVFGVPDDRWQEAICAVILPEDGPPPTAEALRDFVSERIARYKRPRDVIFVDRLPTTDGGAIDRDAVKAEHGAPAT